MPELPNLEQETEEIPPVIETPELPIEPTAVEQLQLELDEMKKKFGASTTENQLLQTRLAAEEAARQELTKEPTDSELRTAFPSWDAMSDTEHDLARRTLGSERAAKKATQLAEDLRNTSSWNTSIELVIASNTALQGKEHAFRQYASRPQYRNVPMDVLVPAFLQTSTSTPAPTTTPKPGLLAGNGGPRPAPKATGLTMEQLKSLRDSDPKGYEKYIKTHDIDLDE